MANIRAECTKTFKCRGLNKRKDTDVIIWCVVTSSLQECRKAGLSSLPPPRADRSTSLTRPFFHTANEKADFALPKCTGQK